jgi:hypothetical protein
MISIPECAPFTPEKIMRNWIKIILIYNYNLQYLRGRLMDPFCKLGGDGQVVRNSYYSRDTVDALVKQVVIVRERSLRPNLSPLFFGEQYPPWIVIRKSYRFYKGFT